MEGFEAEIISLKFMAVFIVGYLLWAIYTYTFEQLNEGVKE